MFDADDRIVWLRHGHEPLRGRVLDDDDGPTTLVMFDGEGEPDEALSADVVLEADYDMPDGEHSVAVPEAYLVYEVTGSVVGPSAAPKQLAGCHGDSLAFTLDTLREEGQIDDDTRIGILYRPDPEQPGVWLINPYARGR